MTEQAVNPELHAVLLNPQFVSAQSEVNGRVQLLTDLNPEFKSLGSNSGLIEVKTDVLAGTRDLTASFILPGQVDEKSEINSPGSHVFSCPGEHISSLKGDYKSGPLGELLKGRTTNSLIEPYGAQEIPAGKDRLYTSFTYIDTDGNKNVVFFLLDLHHLGRMEISLNDRGQLQVDLIRDFEKVNRDQTTNMVMYFGRVDENNPLTDHIQHFKDQMMAHLPGEERAELIQPDPDEPKKITWCTWTAYGHDINTKIIQKMLDKTKQLADFIKEKGEEIKDFIFSITIDDGWQQDCHIGDWKPDKDKFPDFADLLAKIHEAGVDVCLWLAPVLVSPRSKLYDKHPDWLLKNASGKLIRSKAAQSRPGFILPIEYPYILDISIPEVRQHIVDTCVSLAKLGVDEFKVDFLSAVFDGAGLMANNDQATSVEFFRSLIREIRQQVDDQTGKKIKLTACGAWLPVCFGLFDDVRFTADAALSPHTKKLLRSFWGMAARRINKASKEIIDANYAREVESSLASKAGAWGPLFPRLVLDAVHFILDPKHGTPANWSAIKRQVEENLDFLSVITLGDRPELISQEKIKEIGINILSLFKPRS